MSNLVEKLIGAEVTPPALTASDLWIANKLLDEPVIKQFCGSQPERLKLSSLKVEAVEPTQLVFSLKGHSSDHESPHLFAVEVKGVFNLTTKTATRR